MSKKPWPRFIALFTLISIAALPLFSARSGCSTIVVGKKASQTGEVLLGHNEDNEGRLVIARHLVPRLKHRPGEFIVLEEGRARIPQVPETAAFFWSETIASWKASFSDNFVNEWGVAIVSDSCWPSKEKQGELAEGGIGYGLRRIVAERARTAREGVEIAAGLIDRYGYFDSGRTYIIADKTEGWMLQVVMGKHYLAKRIEDDEVAFIPNFYTVHKVDLTDRRSCLASPDLVSYAIRRGWYIPAGSGDFRDFDFKTAYMSPEFYDANWEITTDPGKDYNILREKHALEILTGRVFDSRDAFPFAIKPDKKISLEEVMNVLRAHYEGSPDFLTTSPRPTPHSICTICASETQESLIIQFRDDPRFTVIWLTTGRPCTSPYVPWYLGMKEVPEGYGRVDPGKGPDSHFRTSAEDYGYDPTRAWWAFIDLQNLAEPQYEAGDVVKEIMSRRNTFEAECLKRQASVETEARSLDQAPQERALAYLTNYSEVQAEKARSQAEKIYSRFAVVKIDILADEVRKSGPVKDIQVAILSQKDFEAAEVDASSVRFGPGYVRIDKWSRGVGRLADINRDGKLDLVMTFKVEDALRLAAPCYSDLWITGKTKRGNIFVAKDLVLIKD